MQFGFLIFIWGFAIWTWNLNSGFGILDQGFWEDGNFKFGN